MELACRIFDCEESYVPETLGQGVWGGMIQSTTEVRVMVVNEMTVDFTSKRTQL